MFIDLIIDDIAIDLDTARSEELPDLGWRGEAFAIFFYFDWNINEHGSLLTSNTRFGRLPDIFERIFLDMINFLFNILL